MKKTLRILALALCLLMLSSCGLAEITDSVLNEIGSLPIVKEKITLSIGVQQSSYVIDYDTNALTKLFEENSGVELDIVVFPETDAETKLLLMVNGGSKLPDILTFGTSSTMREQMADAGVLLALDEYFDKETGIASQFYAACERYDMDPDYVLNMVRNSDGHIYGLPKYAPELTGVYNCRAFINEDWLEALNLKTPTTIDELTEVLIAFRDGDPNGNGIKDEIPMTGANSDSLTDNANAMVWLQSMFIYRAKKDHSYLPLSQTGGVLDVCYDKDEYREFLKYVNMLVEEDLLDEAAFTQTQNEMRTQLRADTSTIGVCFGTSTSFGDKVGSWKPLEQLVGYNDYRSFTVNKSEPSICIMITKDCEHPEAAFLFCAMGYDNQLGENFWWNSGRFGEYGVDWRYPEEGEVSSFYEFGLEPTVKDLNGIWGVENNKHWSNCILPVINNGCFLVYNEGDDRINALGTGMNMQYAPDVNDVVGTIFYTEEENSEWAEVRAALKTYLVEANALFAVGQLDPYSDEDWNNYLNELNVLQYKDLIAVDQIAYNRTMGIEE